MNGTKERFLGGVIDLGTEALPWGEEGVLDSLEKTPQAPRGG